MRPRHITPAISPPQSCLPNRARAGHDPVIQQIEQGLLAWWLSWVWVVGPGGLNHQPHPYQVVAPILWNWAQAGQRLSGCLVSTRDCLSWPAASGTEVAHSYVTLGDRLRGRPWQPRSLKICG